MIIIAPWTKFMKRTEYVSDFGRYEGYSEPQYKDLKIKSLYITMRDGVKIAVDVVLPKNLPPDAKIPTLILQTRYWRANEFRIPFRWFQKPNKFLLFFTSYGYAIVFVDVRGTGASFGTWPYPWARDEIMDGGDIVNWIVSQPWSNGKVASVGISYAGVTAELLAVPNHPAVKAVVPRFSQFDLYADQAFPGGIFNQVFVKRWSRGDLLRDQNSAKEMLTHLIRVFEEEEASLSKMQLPKGFHISEGMRALKMGRLAVKGVKPVDSDQSRRLLKEAIQAHANNGDVYRLAEEINYRDDIRISGDFKTSVDDISVHSFKEDIERSKVAIYSWGSWLDAGTADGVIKRFLTYSNPQRAVIGPWSHGAAYHASQYRPPDTPPSPSVTEQWLECLRFFDYYLKDIDNGVIKEKVLVYYTMSEEKWKTTNDWPPVGSTTQRWYISENNTLSQSPPKTKSGEDTYTVNFEATTGKTNRWHTQLGGTAVIYPNRAEEDHKLLTYTSLPLTEDTEITGYPIITLYLASTATDGAFFVYLEDVDETGRVIYITEGQLRAIHRKVSTDPPPYNLLVPYHSFKKKDTTPLVPGEIAELTFGLLPTSVLTKKGHRIRIAISGHDKDTFTRIPAEETPVITVARNKSQASFVDLPIVERNQKFPR
jgi:putative CocE/NonD family hydrolase